MGAMHEDVNYCRWEASTKGSSQQELDSPTRCLKEDLGRAAGCHGVLRHPEKNETRSLRANRRIYSRGPKVFGQI